jgi:hypothetical protein
MRLFPGRFAREWATGFPEDHVLAETSSGRPYYHEEDARRDMATWKRIALYRRRVWYGRWGLAEVKGWDPVTGWDRPHEKAPPVPEEGGELCAQVSRRG